MQPDCEPLIPQLQVTNVFETFCFVNAIYWAVSLPVQPSEILILLTGVALQLNLGSKHVDSHRECWTLPSCTGGPYLTNYVAYEGMNGALKLWR